MRIGVHLMYAVDYGMNWWSGLSANQYCQNSPSWPWWSCKCCLTIARFNWTLCLACFLASIDHTQAHTQNVLGMQFLPRSLHLSPPISPKQPCQSHSPLLRTLKPVQHAQPHPLLCLLAPPLHIPRNLQTHLLPHLLQLGWGGYGLQMFIMSRLPPAAALSRTLLTT